jgi:hypothetical protein
MEPYEYNSEYKMDWPEWLRKAHEQGQLQRWSTPEGDFGFNIISYGRHEEGKRGSFIFQGSSGQIYIGKPDCFHRYGNMAPNPRRCFACGFYEYNSGHEDLDKILRQAFKQLKKNRTPEKDEVNG